jgi:predicted alpha/beta superfamily hydrolase
MRIICDTRLLLAAIIGLTLIAAPPITRSAPAAEEGRPYTLADTQVWSVPDPQSDRLYEVFVSLPASYTHEPERHYPVLYITDADYGFPLIRSITRRVNLDGPVTQEFILVGLSYAKGEDGMTSRRRDYTPTGRGGEGAPKNAVHGQAAQYQNYLRDQVLPSVERKFRADPGRRVFMGHSYGGLLGAQILLSEPQLFRSYILGSPSFWYDNHVMWKIEQAYAKAHRDLSANVFLYVGAFEAAHPNDRRFNRRRDMVQDVRSFEGRLKKRGYPNLRIRSEVVAEENHLTVFPSGFTRGLIQALPAEP